jgi:serine/threonine-protein kinase
MTPQGVPKIVDFNSGIGQGAERLTWPSARCIPGTPSSYSPEHCEAILQEYATRRPVPFQYLPTGDLHALGVIFYEVLTGKHPFGHAKGEELYEAIAHRMPERPRVLSPDVPFGLEKVTMKLLQKKPELRYQSGDQVALDLEALFATGEDWSRPFRTPWKSRRPAPPQTTRMPAASRAWAHRLRVIEPVAPDVPSAIVRAGPRAIVVRETLSLVRPSTPTPQTPGRPKRRLAVVLLLLAAASLLLGRLLVHFAH